MRVASLHVHPVKGGAISTVETVGVGPGGLDGDRRWMVVDANHRFLTQRELPALARLRLREDGDGATLRFDGAERGASPDGERADVVVWRDTVSAATVDAATDSALSEWLGRPVRLVRHDGRSRRATDADWAEAPVAFPDGYPILVVTAASLDAVNAALVERGADTVPMARFRPNVVIEGAEAWADDGWRTIRVGEVTLDLVKPCARCAVTTVDQERGERVGDEPLCTLRDLRMSADRRVPGVLFGWNAVARGSGTLARGDAAEVVERRDRWPIRGRERAGEGSGERAGAPAF